MAAGQEACNILPESRQYAINLFYNYSIMFGIIGYPLQQTFSPGYFSEKFRQLGLSETYQAFPLSAIEELSALLQRYPELRGLNVTIPYKQAVIPFLDELDDTAALIGAVNTIRIAGGKLKGFNTDAIGFYDTLQPLLQEQHTQALVLGTGGAAKAIAYALAKSGISYRFVSRNAGDNIMSYSELTPELTAGYKLIVNTTPLGMAPDVHHCPDIPYAALTAEHLLYDIIYNPPETLFLHKGKALGASTKNGYDMLTGQADAAWKIWQE